MTILDRIRRSTDACARHRPPLVDWVEHRLEGPLTPSALDHLERCRRCEQELTEIAQTVIALRRLAARAAAVEPRADGWPDLRARLEPSRRRPQAAGRSRWGLAGSILGPAIVAVLALRIALPAAPVGAVLPDDGIATSTAVGDASRPMYDSGSRRLTEGIVLILAGRTHDSDGLATWPAISPASTDRRDIRPAVRRVVAPSESTPPRTAYRS
jgi:predicted anti-sigma-YlaC factor YlaD